MGKHKRAMSEETKQKLRDAYKKRTEEKEMFGKKKIETKTFVNGQQQGGQPLQPIQRNELPPPPPPSEELEQIQQPIQYAQHIPQPIVPQQQQPQQIVLQPGYYYWIDDYGEVCMKPIRR